MPPPSSPSCPAPKGGFSVREKLALRTGFYGFVTIGAAAIWKYDATLALVYLALAAVGFVLLIYAFLCAYCPYPYHYQDCLFFPHPLLTRIVPRQRTGMGPIQKWGTAGVMAWLLIWPQFWLYRTPAYTFLFWLAAGSSIAALVLHVCRRCRHRECPFNRASLS